MLNDPLLDRATILDKIEEVFSRRILCIKCAPTMSSKNKSSYIVSTSDLEKELKKQYNISGYRIDLLVEGRPADLANVKFEGLLSVLDESMITKIQSDKCNYSNLDARIRIEGRHIHFKYYVIKNLDKLDEYCEQRRKEKEYWT